MGNELQEKKNLIAQWAFDSRPILGRFRLWLKDIEIEWIKGEETKEFLSEFSFLNGRIERLITMTGAITALGTQLFGRFGEGANLDKNGLNQVKKDADAISAYVMSECLWALSRELPENHAIMVCLGEGLMAKGGETPEMGSNPQLGFGRIYARAEVAHWLEQKVIRLLNDEGYNWDQFYHDIKESSIIVWGTAIDTLENTSRFAKGCDTGQMTVLHIFNQPLCISKPYEGYLGNLFLPKEVVEKASEHSVLINFQTPRALIVEAIEQTYPGIQRTNIHVWTLRGKSRVPRIGDLWKEWEDLGVHIVEDDWKLSSGMTAFTESGTYAPTYSIGTWLDEKTGSTHLFICDGYAASAEAMQAASLAPMLGLEASLSVFTSSFKLPYTKEHLIMRLDPEAKDFKDNLEKLIGAKVDDDAIVKYKSMICEAVNAGILTNKRSINADDFFPEKYWDILAVTGYMRPDPYSGAAGVEQIEPDVYRVTVRLAAPKGIKLITFTLRRMESLEVCQLVFNPLLNRFLSGEDYKNRPVKISDSGRIRNELQTLCSEALEFMDDERIGIDFDRIVPAIISDEKKKELREILSWYKTNHPAWFAWIEILD
jgi:hypothetical protein